VQNCSGDVTIPSDVTPGTYWIGAIADDQGTVTESNESNNALAASNSTTIEGSGPTQPDLVVTEVTAPATGTVGSSIALTSRTENQGGEATGAFEVGIYLSTDTNIELSDRRIAYCSAESLDAGYALNCSGNVTIPATVTPGTYWVGAIADDGGTVTESNESNNDLAASNSTAIEGSGPTQPDLVMTEVTAPATGNIGAQIAVTSRTENLGGVAAGAFEVGIYLSTNDIISSLDRRIAFCSAESLDVGSALNCSGDVTIPADVTPGTYWIGALADDQGTVEESDESNNDLAASNSTTMTGSGPLPPDLVATEVTGPATGTAGATIAVTSTTMNQGEEAAGAFEVGIYLSTNTTITSLDRRIGYCSAESLDGGSTFSCGGDVTVPAEMPSGTYWVGIIADDQHTVTESNEGNNDLAASSSTTIENTGPAPPDLVITEVTAPTTGTVGGQIAVTSRTENQGELAAGAFEVGIYLSTNDIISSLDRRIAYCSAESLDAGSGMNCSGDVTIPGDVTPGAYWIGAIADDQNAVTETDENNNDLAASNSTVIEGSGETQPDLVVTEMTAPATGTAGSTVALTTVTENQGTGAAGAFELGVYLSTDSTITTSDRRFAYCTAEALNVGSSLSCSGSVTIPADVAPGTYWIGAIADDQGTVTESDETNNSRAAANSTIIG
jgi:subtilase family serine protease